MDGLGARKKVIIIGAGASGRGHVGQRAFESGYELVLLDPLQVSVPDSVRDRIEQLLPCIVEWSGRRT